MDFEVIQMAGRETHNFELVYLLLCFVIFSESNIYIYIYGVGIVT